MADPGESKGWELIVPDPPRPNQNRPTHQSNHRTTSKTNPMPAVDSKQVNCNLFTKETEEDYPFENKDLSLEPTFECFDLQEVAVERYGKDVTGNFDSIDLLALNGKLMLHSIFDPTEEKMARGLRGLKGMITILTPTTNTWPLPKPSPVLQSPTSTYSKAFA
ncbi:uncharacterized protein VP01_289g7 [Puccinia sorghi]|uniref:Uncharacterized protein n=1 Tax=Puccinia sorghi TaxID=27349 RepID=A0A0L6V3D5_9BASI|nr:uncharacterized protein VP01_289g7 [Puccinia sorghi]